MAGLFNTVVARVPRRNAFSRSFENDLTVNFGVLAPFLCEEVFPGDDFRFRTEVSIKLAEMIAPAMARIDAYMHYFFVPNRLLYVDWEDFITGGLDGTFANGTMLNPVSPCADFNDLLNQGYCDTTRLGDYLGLPSLPHGQGQVYDNLPPISLFPFLAYQKIYSDYYKDELLSNVPNFEPHPGGKVSGSGLYDICTTRYRAWKKDYFTSARPDTQLGPQISIPISGDISSNGTFKFNFSEGSGVLNNRTYALGSSSSFEQLDDGTVNVPVKALSSGGNLTNGGSYGEGLSLQDASVLVNELRRSLKLQEWSEKNMRGGNRYIENIFHHFGVKSSDARLQRAQYIGGRKVPVLISEILQSTGTVGDQQYSQGARYLGSRGGTGNAVGSSQRVHYYSEEHGFLIGILSIMPHALYMQGIPRMFGDRWDRFSYLWPEFGNLGEQEVYNWELFVEAGAGKPNDGVFGYQSRYADLKQNYNQVHGEFRDNLQYWTTARIFANRPQLNNNFVTMSSSADADGMNKIFAVTSNAVTSHFRCQMFNKITVLRMLPKYGIPSI